MSLNQSHIAEALTRVSREVAEAAAAADRPAEAVRILLATKTVPPTGLVKQSRPALA